MLRAEWVGLLLLLGSVMSAAQERPVTEVRTPPKMRDPDRVGWMRSVLGGSNTDPVGPFLMLDHWGGTYQPHEAVSGSDHPHRGQETVSYILEGGIHHEDSAGNEGWLSEGWVQWMTAGSGVMHSEMHADDIWENGGTVEGFQLWVNLLAKDKMVPPRYQDTPKELIPSVTSADKLCQSCPHPSPFARSILRRDALSFPWDSQSLIHLSPSPITLSASHLSLISRLLVTCPFFAQPPPILPSIPPTTKTHSWVPGKVKVIAGESMGTPAVIETRTPLMYLDVGLEPGGILEQAIDSSWQAMGYVFRGECSVGPKESGSQQTVRSGQLFILGKGDKVTLQGPKSGETCRILLLGGWFPKDEPVAWHGPFVMNTQQQIRQTIQDYQQGKFGIIKGHEGRDKKRAEARENISRRLAKELR